MPELRYFADFLSFLFDLKLIWSQHFLVAAALGYHPAKMSTQAIVAHFVTHTHTHTHTYARIYTYIHMTSGASLNNMKGDAQTTAVQLVFTSSPPQHLAQVTTKEIAEIRACNFCRLYTYHEICHIIGHQCSGINGSKWSPSQYKTRENAIDQSGNFPSQHEVSGTNGDCVRWISVDRSCKLFIKQRHRSWIAMTDKNILIACLIAYFCAYYRRLNLSETVCLNCR